MRPFIWKFIWNFLRPKSASVKKRPFMTVKPDIDNLEKLVKDAMKGIIYRDDSLVVGVHKFKQYAEPPGCLIRVFTMAERSEIRMGEMFVTAGIRSKRAVNDESRSHRGGWRPLRSTSGSA